MVGRLRLVVVRWSSDFCLACQALGNYGQYLYAFSKILQQKFPAPAKIFCAFFPRGLGPLRTILSANRCCALRDGVARYDFFRRCRCALHRCARTARAALRHCAHADFCFALRCARQVLIAIARARSHAVFVGSAAHASCPLAHDASDG